VGNSILRKPLQVDLPALELATHVYKPWSCWRSRSDIIKSPDVVIFNLELGCTGIPSRYHDIVGLGRPIALHCSVASDLMGSVWFTGPDIIIGGGRSSCESKLSWTLEVMLATSFIALHSMTRSLSVLWNLVRVRIEWPSSVFRLWNRSKGGAPGNISVLLFLMVQKMVGFGLPVARHSKDVSAPSSTDLLAGRWMNFGGATVWVCGVEEHG